jgi:hypothetical protein
MGCCRQNYLEIEPQRRYQFDTFKLQHQRIKMPDTHRRKLEELDPDSIKVTFSPRVKGALGDLDAAVHFSEHFDGDAYAILHDWAKGGAPTVGEVIVALPLIARSTFEHIRATGDKRADDAWHEIGSQLFEQGFKLTKSPLRQK